MSGAHSERAWAALSHDRYDLAEREFRLVLTEHPDDARSHAGLALSLCNQEKFDDAERESGLAIGLAPDFDFCHYVHGIILRDRNRFAEAASAAEEAIRLDPEDANNRSLLASIRGRQERWQDCLAAADAGLAIDPEHDGCTNLRALALTQLGRKDEASATIAEALQRSPENSMTHANQGWALLHRNDPQQAQVHFREALRLDPTNDFAREGLLNAIKAQNVLFRGMLAYFLFMGRQRASLQWLFIIVIIFGRSWLTGVAKQNPELGIVIYPLLAVVAVAIYSTWLAHPLMNLVMRFHPQGRHALTHDQHIQANLVAACLFLAAGLFSIELALGLKSHLPSFMVLLVSFPLTMIHDSSPGWPRRISIVAATTFALIALFEVFALHVARLAVLQERFQDSEVMLFLILASIKLIPVFFYGILLWSLASMFWIQKAEPKR